MLDNKDLNATLLLGEREWLDQVIYDLSDHTLKLVYADWLEEQGDNRSEFLRDYVQAIQSTEEVKFPEPLEGHSVWLDLIGYRLMSRTGKLPGYRKPFLKYARPALRYESASTELRESNSIEDTTPVGCSKTFGFPDLPESFAWPTGDDCAAIFNDETAGEERHAGFVAQINLSEVAGLPATKLLPQQGLLSIFCFMDGWDNPDKIGVGVFYFPEISELVRTQPTELSEGNEIIPVQEMKFTEALDIPEFYDGPWSQEINPQDISTWDGPFEELRWDDKDYNLFMGYDSATSGADPTTSKESKYLFTLESPGGCQLHAQIPEDELKRQNFKAVTLDWVDFD